MRTLETKIDFLVSEFWVLSWNTSVQRARVYRDDAEDTARTEFRNGVIDWVTDELLTQYRKDKVFPLDHNRNIELLSKHASQLGSHILNDGQYSIGIAQNLINLQLKYLWCLGIVHIPPHCPIDDLIMLELPRDERVSWTDIDDLADYQAIISKLDKLATEESKVLAKWELDLFRGLRPTHFDQTTVVVEAVRI